MPLQFGFVYVSAGGSCLPGGYILLRPTPASCHRGLLGVGEDTVELCVNEQIRSVGRPLYTSPPFICPLATTNLGALCEVARDNILSRATSKGLHVTVA